MRDIHAAAVLFADDPAVLNAVESCIVWRGERAYIDRDELGRVRPAALGALADFIERSAEVLSGHRDGRGGLPFTVAEVELVHAIQRDDKSGRVDLSDQLTDASAIPGLGVILEEATGASPSWERVVHLATGWGGRVEHEAQRTTLTLNVPNAKGWCESWGGNPESNELRRRVTIEFNHAAWRDRRVRRLQSVRVTADQLWADVALEQAG